MEAKTLRAGAAFLLVGMLFATGCRQGDAAQGHGDVQMPPPAVTVVRVVAQEVIEWDEFTGRTAAMENGGASARLGTHRCCSRLMRGGIGPNSRSARRITSRRARR